jgi:hypothetical protein
MRLGTIIFYLFNLLLFRVATVSLMLAFKYYCEKSELIPNSEFAKILSIDSSDLLQMELTFTNLLDFRLHISNKDFIAYQKQLSSIIPAEDKA